MLTIKLLSRDAQAPMVGVPLMLVFAEGWSGPAVTDANGLATFAPGPGGVATVYVEGLALFRGPLSSGSTFFVEERVPDEATNWLTEE